MIVESVKTEPNHGLYHDTRYEARYEAGSGGVISGKILKNKVLCY